MITTRLVLARSSFVRVTLSFVLLLVVAPDVRAQQVRPPLHLAELLPDLILREITLPRVMTGDVSHEAHFSPIEANELNNPAVGIVQTFNKLMMVQLSTFPLGSSTGGFTYTFDESLGTFRRASSSFEGQDLDDGSLKFYLRHEECCSSGGGGGAGGGGGGAGAGPIERPNGTRLNPPFEGDLIEAALSLKASTDTAAFFANYGLTNRWDVGIVVPVVRVDLDASVQATILRLATPSEPQLHTFEPGNPNAIQRIFRQSGTAVGLGDSVLRTKYQVVRFAGGGLAGAVDIRLPTGNKKDLLGAGTQVKMFLVASGGTGRFMEHVNVGYTGSAGNVERFGLLSTLGGDVAVPDELNYAAGLEFVAEPRLTLVADIVGRTLRNAGRLELKSKPFEFQGSTAVQTARFDELDPRAGSLPLVLGTTGFKFNPAGDLLISASVLFPLTDTGLRSRLTTVVGLDYAF